MDTVPPVEAGTAPISRPVTFLGAAIGYDEAPLLEGRLFAALDGTLHPGVVLCHANPAAGGHMEMAVMVAIEEALAAAGIATLRYNSRGIGNSGGTVSHHKRASRRLVAPEGEPETEDVGAALGFIAAQAGVDDERLALVGHSFGARISLAYLAAHPDDRVQGVVCIGLPVAWRDLSHLGEWPRPKLFVTGERDDFSPPDKLAHFIRRLPAPASQVTLRETGHFFEGREADLAAAVAEFLKPVLGC